MRIDLKIQYKSDTGKSPIFELESQRLTEELDSRIFEENTKREIIDMINYDSNYNAKWGVFMDQLPKEFQLNEDLIIPSADYVQWLEDKVLNALK